MPVIFESDVSAPRVAAARAYARLTSTWLTGTMLASFIAAGVLWCLWAMLIPSDALLGIAVFLSSLTGLLLLIFTFATTYFPFIQPRYTLGQLQHGLRPETTMNSAEAAELALLSLLRPLLKLPEAARLPAMLMVLWNNPAARTMLRRLEIPINSIRAAAAPLAVLPWQQFVYDFTFVAVNAGAARIMVEHVVAAVLLQPALKNFLREHDLREKDITFVVWWITAIKTAAAERRRWWDRQRLLDFTGLGLRWTSGYTPLLDQFARFPKGNLWDQVPFGREQHVDQLITTLARQRQSNVLLVGQPGSGRLGVVLEMVRRINGSHAHPALNGHRVVYLHIGEVLARGTSNASQLAIISQVLTEMERAGNIIAVIDGMGSILGAEGESRLNLSDVLLPFFSSLSVRVIVIISSEEYHLRLKSNQELLHFFEVLQVDHISPEATLQVVAVATPGIEATTHVQLPYRTLRTIVEETEAILPHIPFPERAFDVLEEAIVIAQQKRLKVIESTLVEQLISQKVGIPLGKIRTEERAHLLDLEKVMHQRLVNQHTAVTTLARAMIRARAGVRTRARPIGTFLFLGPTGVGKTEAAKTLAHAYFGSEDYLRRLDMSEFQTTQSIESLIGGPSHPVGRLTSLIADHPFTVLLLDEFEKAHSAVHQLFLQVFDEGRLTDARGQQVSFQHAIIIATSNAGAELIRRAVEAGPLPADFDDVLREHILRENIFRPELLNRFDGVVTFTPLSPAHIEEVAVRMLAKLNQRLDQTHGITVAVTPPLVAYLVSVGYHPEFGARPMARAIQDTVEYAVAQRILKNSVQPGEQITLHPDSLRALQV